MLGFENLIHIETIESKPVDDFVQFELEATVLVLSQHGHWNVYGQLFEVKPQAMC